MSLSHSPAQIIARLLATLGVGVTGGTVGDWPIYVSDEPNSPDNAITLYDTSGQNDGRSMIDGEVQEHPGVEVRIRSSTHEIGFAKAAVIAEILAMTIYQNTVVISTNQYLVHSITRKGTINYLGRENPTSKRQLFTINCLAAIRKLV